MSTPTHRKPEWLRVRLPGGSRYQSLRETFRQLELNTVCEEARCPNVGECWEHGTATLMLLGDVCTRGCRFCAVKSGNPGGLVDPREPENVALALARMDLAYVVLTMVDRDDLRDGGAEHVARTVRHIKERCPDLLVETLVGDFAGMDASVDTIVIEGRPDVFAHNVEVVPELQREMRDARCSWERSVAVLERARRAGARITKSSLMVGCGETPAQVLNAMSRLRDAGVDVLTIGQYLQPTKKHAPVARWVEPAELDAWARAGEGMGFRYVAAGPLVRSSYRAAEAFLRSAAADGNTGFDDPYGGKRKLAVVH